MEKLKVGDRRFTDITIMDKPGHGGACHEYRISRPINESDEVLPSGEFGMIYFQKGPIKEFGVNGCSQEDLLLIVIHRLQSFQSGSFACRENALALTKVQEALHWLNHRTNDRISRGVEGLNVK